MTSELKIYPATSPVKTRGFGKISEGFITQVYRSMPTEGHERKQLVDKSVSFMQSLHSHDERGGGAGGSTVGQLGGISTTTGSVVVGEAAFSPSQSMELAGGVGTGVEAKDGPDERERERQPLRLVRRMRPRF